MTDDHGGESPIAIQLTDIVKRFPGVVANDGVDLTVHRGTVHAIVGENGAGKSTLMKTLYGAHKPDEGTITVNGKDEVFHSPKDAIAEGIGMVFQAFMLADNLTVWENIVLGDEPGSAVSLDIKAARSRITELAERYGLEIDPNALISDLGVGEKQRVEILKVLYRGAKILILDEPTAVLVPQEVDELFASLRELTEQGSTIIFISHKLDEVLKHADAITVIRQGKTVGEVPDPSSVTSRELAEMMVGSELPTPETRESTVTDVPVLELRDLTVAGGEGRARKALDGVTFTVHRGEIVGIAGVEGNGQSELVNALVGLEEATGTILLDGVDIGRRSTRERRDAGVGYIAEDRQKDGLVMSFTLWENAALGHQHRPPYGKGPWLNVSGAKEQADTIVQGLRRPHTGDQRPAFTLSGGNQQKMVVGREMTADPKLLVAAHPTRGVDVGAQAGIWDVLRDARAAGLGTVLVSADLEELIGLSDRLLVMLRGGIVAELDPSTVTPADLGSYMTGAKAGPPDAREDLAGVARTVIAAVAAILISSVALLISGNSPVEAFTEMWKTIDSRQSVVTIINTSVPLYIAGIAAAIGFKMNLFNIGTNGQYLLAALVAGWAGAEVDLPPIIHVPFVIVVAMLVGGSWALIAGILNVTRNVNVVVATIMLNYIGIGLAAFLLQEVFRDEETGGPGRPDQADAGVGAAAVAQPDLRVLRVRLPRQRRAVRLPADRDPPRHRLLRAAQPQPLRLRAEAVRPQPGGGALGGRQPEEDGADHPLHVGGGRRHDRPAVPDVRSELPQVRRRVPDPARLHRARHRPARPQRTRRRRRRRRGVGDDRTGHPTPRPARHPAGDRPHPAGLVPAGRRDRLRGRQAPQRRSRRRRRREGDRRGPGPTGTAGRSGRRDVMSITADTRSSRRRSEPPTCSRRGSACS